MAEIDVNSVEEAQQKLEELKASGEKINKPTEEETKAAVQEFEDAKQAFNEKKYDIGTAEEADLVAYFLLDFLDKYVFWTKSGWMGVIKLQEEIKELQTYLRKGSPFTLGYQALEFTFFALSNPGGFGLASALDMEKIAENYAKVFDLCGKQLESAREAIKDIQWLQDKSLAMQQGFYLEREIEKPEEIAAMTEEEVLAESKRLKTSDTSLENK
jgi:hypothetical protein